MADKRLDSGAEVIFSWKQMWPTQCLVIIFLYSQGQMVLYWKKVYTAIPHLYFHPSTFHHILVFFLLLFFATCTSLLHTHILIVSNILKRFLCILNLLLLPLLYFKGFFLSPIHVSCSLSSTGSKIYHLMAQKWKKDGKKVIGQLNFSFLHSLV